MFLIPGHDTLDWSKGIHVNSLKEEWRHVLSIIQRYVTCEGRFATIYRYHLRFLLHITWTSKLSLPFYLLKSLSKMAMRVKNHPDHSSHNIFNHVLIKLLVLNELKKRNWAWLHFLFWSRFEVEKYEVAEVRDDGKEEEGKTPPNKGLISYSKRHKQGGQETPKQLKIYKIKVTEQRSGHKVDTEAEQSKKRDEVDKEKIVVTPRTPSHFEEEPEEKESKTCIPELFNGEIKLGIPINFN